MSFPERFLKFILRLNGVLAILAIGAVLMPHSWLVWCVSRVEPELHVGFLVSYLARSLSMFFVLVGIFLLIFAMDVRLYRRAITCTAWWVVGAIVCFVAYCWPYLSDLMAYWFFWFVVGDAAFSLVFAAAILVCQFLIRHGEETSCA